MFLDNTVEYIIFISNVVSEITAVHFRPSYHTRPYGVLIIETEGRETYRNWSTYAMGVLTGRELSIGTNIHKGALIRKGCYWREGARSNHYGTSHFFLPCSGNHFVFKGFCLFQRVCITAKFNNNAKCNTNRKCNKL